MAMAGNQGPTGTGNVVITPQWESVISFCTERHINPTMLLKAFQYVAENENYTGPILLANAGQVKPADTLARSGTRSP
ncbi:MAG: hypothetical protein NVS2B16_36980 [Chloroflexota bacterium]